MTVREKRFSLTDVYGAEEAFVTGTFAGLCPVREVDGRIIGEAQDGALPGPVVRQLTALYKDLVDNSLTPIGG